LDTKKKIFFGAAALFFVTLFLVIIFGRNGYIDLRRLDARHQELVEKNEKIESENQGLYRSVQRLKKNDPAYIENLAKQELGMIAEDEVIFKFNKEKQNK